jgi:hypothetical protein
LKSIIADRARCAHRFFDIAGFNNVLDPVSITRPNACQKICLELEPDRKLIVFRLTHSTARRLHTIANAEQVLHVMSNFVGDDVGLCEIPSRAETILELTKKTEIDVNASILRTIERTGGATGEPAAGLNQVREKHEPRFLVLPAHLAEDLVPGVFGIGENDGDEFRRLIAWRLIVELADCGNCACCELNSACGSPPRSR